MATTKIEWTRNPDGTAGKTWNPIVGCSRVGPGCDGCYAIGVAHRGMQDAHRGLTVKRPGERVDWTGEVRLLPERLDEPLRWRKPQRVFPCSMSDLFHADVPDDYIAKVFATMAVAKQHTFQVLTKRPQRMADLLNRYPWWVGVSAEALGYSGERGPMQTQPDSRCALLNVWLGSSIENDTYSWRANHVRRTPAAVRWLSLEPLLGPLPSLDLTGIDWAVVGGESGPRARRMDPAWLADIRDRCAMSGTALFVKQAGSVLAKEWGMATSSGHDLDGFPEEFRVREYPEVALR